jgi:hypothetical protein
MKCLGLFLLVLLLIIPTCAKQRGVPSRISGAKYESLSVVEAMEAFYGNYDPDSQTSTFNLPDGMANYVLLRKNEPMLASAFFNALASEKGSKKFILLTYAVPKDREFSCHACAPVIGMAVFSRAGREWTIESSSRAVTTSGGYAHPPTGIRIVQIGSRLPAIEIRDSGTGGGETTTGLLILAPWKGTVNLALERVIADNDAGGCGNVACYSNHRAVSYLRSSSGNYFDIRLTLKGTDFGDPSNQLRHVHGIEILRFQDGRYVQVSRNGDLTNLDKVVSTREGLN